jgi:hypothetical protein
MWRRLHNEELHNLYASPSIIRVIKTRRMKWVGHLACMRDMRNTYNTLLGKPEGKRPLGRPRCIDGKIMLNWILEKEGGRV